MKQHAVQTVRRGGGCDEGTGSRGDEFSSARAHAAAGRPLRYGGNVDGTQGQQQKRRFVIWFFF